MTHAAEGEVWKMFCWMTSNAVCLDSKFVIVKTGALWLGAVHSRGTASSLKRGNPTSDLALVQIPLGIMQCSTF